MLGPSGVGVPMAPFCAPTNSESGTNYKKITVNCNSSLSTDNLARKYCSISFLAMMASTCYRVTGGSGATASSSPASRSSLSSTSFSPCLSSGGSSAENAVWSVEEIILVAVPEKNYPTEDVSLSDPHLRLDLKAVKLPNRKTIPAPPALLECEYSVVLSLSQLNVLQPPSAEPLPRPMKLVTLGGTDRCNPDPSKLVMSFNNDEEYPGWRRTATMHRGRVKATGLVIPPKGHYSSLVVAIGGCCKGSTVELIQPHSGVCQTGPRLVEPRFCASSTMVVLVCHNNNNYNNSSISFVDNGIDEIPEQDMRLLCKKYTTTTTTTIEENDGIACGYLVVFGGRSCADRGDVLRSIEKLDLHSLDPKRFAPVSKCFFPSIHSHSFQDGEMTEPATSLLQNCGSLLSDKNHISIGTERTANNLLLDSSVPVIVSGETVSPQFSRWCFRSVPDSGGLSNNSYLATSSLSRSKAAELISDHSTAELYSKTNQVAASQFDKILEWELGKSLSQARYDSTAATIHGTMWSIVIGGNTGARVLATTELFNPFTNKSIPGPILLYARTRPAVTITPDGLVVVYGGLGHLGTTVESIEVWDSNSFVQGHSIGEVERFVEVPYASFMDSCSYNPEDFSSALIPDWLPITINEGESISNTPKFHIPFNVELAHCYKNRQQNFEKLSVESWSSHKCYKLNESLVASDSMRNDAGAYTEFNKATPGVQSIEPYCPFNHNESAAPEKHSLEGSLDTGRFFSSAGRSSGVSTTASYDHIIPPTARQASLHSKFVEKLKRRGSWIG